jgi:bifunctional non-homologous end joining protein LigD
MAAWDQTRWLSVIARKTGAQVRLYSRPGNDLTYRFPLIVETLARLQSRSCIIDGEAVACDDRRRFVQSGSLPSPWRRYIPVRLRPDRIERRRSPTSSARGPQGQAWDILVKAGAGIRFNEHMEGDGDTVFRHACKLGLEGIVSKRKDSAYRSGRSPDWLKMKNADAPTVKREEEEQWSKRKPW